MTAFQLLHWRDTRICRPPKRNTLALIGKVDRLLISLLVQSIYYFDPSQIATEGFPSPFISLKYIDQHMKSLEKSKKGKIQFITETI